MSTTTTPELALVKPTPGTGEPAAISVINTNMDLIDDFAEIINDILAQVIAGGSDYTPVWTKASGTAPTLGNGSITGRYMKIGRLVLFNIVFIWGSTTNANGSELWNISLPPFTRVASPTAVCTAFAVNDSGGNYHVGIGEMGSGGTVIIRARFDGVASGSNASMSSVHPFTWAVGDNLTFTGWYEAAA